MSSPSCCRARLRCDALVEQLDWGCVVAGQAQMGQANLLQGYYGEGFVASIAAAAGLDVKWPRLGVATDMGIYTRGPNGTSSSRQITVQVKSWSTGGLSADGTFHYPLPVRAFNALAGDDHDVRHYLVLCIVPGDAIDYADPTHDRLKLLQAAYWHSLRDEDPDPTLNPESTKTVYVSSKNLLTPQTLRALVDRNEAGAVVP